MSIEVNNTILQTVADEMNFRAPLTATAIIRIATGKENASLKDGNKVLFQDIRSKMSSIGFNLRQMSSDNSQVRYELTKISKRFGQFPCGYPIDSETCTRHPYNLFICAACKLGQKIIDKQNKRKTQLAGYDYKSTKLYG